MNLEELINTWKNQDTHINIQLRDMTMQHFFKEKSTSVLKKIEKCLIRELLIIILAIVCFDALFFAIKMPISPLRWICFTIFNVIAFLHMIFYLKALAKTKLNFSDDLETNLQGIIEGLTQFRNQYKLAHMPIVFVCIVMFAVSQELLMLIPWMILEFLFWKWILLAKLRSRFLDYKFDLEYTLKQLQESRD
jgi:hypothetical protein